MDDKSLRNLPMILVADHLFVVVFLQLFRKKNSIFVPEIGIRIYLFTFFVVVAVYLFIFLLIYYLVFWRNKNEPPHGYPQTSFSLQYFYIFLIF